MTLVWSRLRTRDAAVRHCYERGLRLDNDLQGSLLLRFDIDEHGAGNVRVLDSDLGAFVDECVVEAVEGLDVPSTVPDHVIQLSLPYRFVPIPQEVDPPLQTTEPSATENAERATCPLLRCRDVGSD